MRGLALLLAIYGSVSSALCASATTVEGVWLVDGMEWSRSEGDKDISPVETAEAEILYFGPDGKFQLMDCWLIRNRDGSISISNGDPRKVSIGSWLRNNDTIEVSFKLVEVTVTYVGQTLPGPLRQGRVGMDRDRSLSFEGKMFQRTDRLDRYFQADL